MRGGDPGVDGSRQLLIAWTSRGVIESRSARLQVTVVTRGLAIALIALGISLLWLTELASPAIAPFDVCDGLEGSVQSLTASAGGRTIVACSTGGKLTMWEPGSFPTQIAACAKNRESNRAALSASANRLALAEPKHSAVLWDLATGRPALLPPGPRPIRALAFSSDGAILALADVAEIQLMDVATRQRILTQPLGLPGVMSLAFSPDGRILAMGCKDGSLRLHSLAEWGPRPAIQAHSMLLSSLAFSADGKLLASASHAEDHVNVWSAAVGKCLARLENHTTVQSLAFAPDVPILAAGGWDGSVRIWDLAMPDSPPVAFLLDTPVTALAFSVDGTTLACGGMGSIRVYRMANLAGSLGR